MESDIGGSAGLVSHVETSPIVDFQELDTPLSAQLPQQAQPTLGTMAHKGHQLAPGAPAFELPQQSSAAFTDPAAAAIAAAATATSSSAAKAAAPEAEGAKQQICFDFTKNQCSRGASCKFSHNVDLIIQVNSQEKGICFDFLKGMCSRGALCRFSHDLNNLQVPPSLITPTGVAPPSMAPTATAAFDQIQPPVTSQATMAPRRINAPICYDFVKSQCTRGDECKYSHDYSSILNGPRPGQKNPYVVCVDFTRGRCTRGAACRYSHGAPLCGGSGGGGGGGTGMFGSGQGALPMGLYSPLAAASLAAGVDPAVLAAAMAGMQGIGGGVGCGGNGGGGNSNNNGGAFYGQAGAGIGGGAGKFISQHHQYQGQLPLPNNNNNNNNNMVAPHTYYNQQQQYRNQQQGQRYQQEDTIRASWGGSGGGSVSGGGSNVPGAGGGYHAEYAALLHELQNTSMNPASASAAVAPQHQMLNEVTPPAASAAASVAPSMQQQRGEASMLSMLLLQQQLLQQQQQHQGSLQIHDNGGGGGGSGGGGASPQSNTHKLVSGAVSGTGAGAAQLPRVPFHHGGSAGPLADHFSKVRAESNFNQGNDSPTIRASWGDPTASAAAATAVASTQTQTHVHLQTHLQTPAGPQSLSVEESPGPATGGLSQSYGSPFGGDSTPGFEALKSIWSEK